MARLTDCNVIILSLQDAKKNSRMKICEETFGMIENGAIVIGKLFKTIYFYPDPFSSYDVQAHMTKNSCTIFPSVHTCLCSLNQQRQNVVLVVNKLTYVTDKTVSLAQTLHDLSNEYGNIFELEYDAVNNCLKEKIKSIKRVKDVSSLKYGIIPPRKMGEELNNKSYCPNLKPFAISSIPIFRTNNEYPASLMDVVNSKIDPYSLTAEQSSLGEIVPDCAEEDSLSARSTTLSPQSHQTRNRNSDVHNATVNYNNPTLIERLEVASGSGVIPPSLNGSLEQNGNHQQSPRYPGYRTYHFINISIKKKELKLVFPTHLKLEGDSDNYFTGVHEPTRGFLQKPSRGRIDTRMAKIRRSSCCRFALLLLEAFPTMAVSWGVTGGSSDPVFTDSDHIRSPQYQAYRVRLSTFTKWPSSMTQKPEEVAQAGFYYTGINDVVRCFACDGGLKNWDPGDDPWIEHARWFSQCPFVKKVKGQDFIELVKRMIDAMDEEEEAVVDSTFQRNNVLVNQSESQQLSVGNDIDEPSQLDTDAAQAVIEMGYSKSAVAMAIDILISNDKKGYTAEDILCILLEKEDRGELLPTDSNSELPQNQSKSFRSTQNVKEDTECDTENDNGDTQTILRENKSLKSMVTCIKCKQQARNMLFLPCTHHCLCHICAAKCSLCPMCYRTIKQKIKTFMI
ncbi:hypothetical protein ACJMK2_029377 [Sinanodonta woodiana]|uniref:RING-type domain-containing protein n=1 Tax=Sinanodonta woodiana TaxID=1069815 RepID=A0ABD3X9Z6_SINWO